MVLTSLSKLTLVVLLACLSIQAEARRLQEASVTSHASSTIESVTDAVNQATEAVSERVSNVKQSVSDIMSSAKVLFSGEGTAYSDAVDDGTGFACSYKYLPQNAKKNFVAVPPNIWDDGKACGKCVHAWCTDERCKKQYEPITAMVVDLCPECSAEPDSGVSDLDFSIPAYENVTGMWPHRLKIEWTWGDCADWYSGDIRIDLKAGSNQFWRALFFSNARYPIIEAHLNGRAMKRQQFNFWTDSGDLGSGPYDLELKSVRGQIIKAKVNDLSTQEIGAQFSRE